MGPPLAESAAASGFWSRAGDGRPLDLGSLLVIVPTRNAGRRLGGCWPISPANAARPSSLRCLLRPPSSPGPNKAPCSRACRWQVIWKPWQPGSPCCSGSTWRRLRAFSPSDPPAQDFAWARSTARDLASLRRTLGEAGLGFQDVAALLPKLHEESERWLDLARLEAAWIAFLRDALSRCDREGTKPGPSPRAHPPSRPASGRSSYGDSRPLPARPRRPDSARHGRSAGHRGHLCAGNAGPRLRSLGSAPARILEQRTGSTSPTSRPPPR